MDDLKNSFMMLGCCHNFLAKLIYEFYLNYITCAGLLQSTILESVGCIWFNRSEAKDREIVARKLV
jgi:hypothetical protein